MRTWILLPLFCLLLASCSGKGGKLLSFLDSDEGSDDFGSVVGSDPNSVNSLVSWFKTDDLLTVSAAAPTNVTEWKSSVEGTPSLIVPAGQTAPSVISWPEGGNALSFDAGMYQGLQMPGFSIGSFEAFSVVMVLKVQAPGSLLHFGSDMSTKDDSGVISTASGGKFQIQHVSFANTDYNTKEAVVGDLTQAHVIIATFAPSSDWRDNHIYIDGFRAAATTGSSLGTPTPFVSLTRHLYLGASSVGAKFSVAEIAVYGRQLTPRDAYSLSKGLGAKWKIPVKEKITKEIYEDKIDRGIKEITFETLKRDIFATKGCLGCHNSSMKADGIDLSTYAGVKNGVSSSTSKRVAIPGQATSSGLFSSVTGTIPQMPKLATSYGGFLSDAQTSEISVWINKGMKENESSTPLPSEGGTGSGPDEETDPGLAFEVYDDVYYGVLNSKCISCHNPTKKSGGVDLSSYVAVRGGKNSSNQDLIIPGSPNTSRLYQTVSGYGLAGGLPKMPGSGIYLSTAEKDLIKNWITQGALQDYMSILSGPTGFVSATSATFTFSGKAPESAAIAAYECSLDGATFASCVSPKTYTSLSMTPHSFQVRYLDSAGNRSAVSTASWTVDFLPPAIPTVTSPPLEYAKSTSGGFTFTSIDQGRAGILNYQCKIDAEATYTTCTSRKNYTGLAQGAHTFSLTATDHAGNVSDPYVFAWYADTGLPTAALTSMNSAATYYTGTVQNISWTASDTIGLGTNPISLEYTTDGTTWTSIATGLANTSPYAWTLPMTPTTLLKVRIIVTDKATNVRTVASAANMTLQNDVVAPTLSLTGAPSADTNQTTANFTFSATDGGVSGITYQCKLDAAAYEGCTSIKTYTSLAEGAHTFSVTATDAAGNVSNAASHSWSIDTTLPTVSLTSMNGGSFTVSTAQNITWTAADDIALATTPINLEYTTDGTTWTTIAAAYANTSPYSWTLPAAPTTTLKVRITVTDGAGNTATATSAADITTTP